MHKADSYKDIFDQRALSYHQAMQTCPDARDQEFKTLLSMAHLKPGVRVIDIPSGGGYLAWYLPSDISLCHVDFSRAFASMAGLISPHPFVLSHDKSLPLQSSSVDRILSLAGVHHIQDKKPLFKEMARILKPGGMAVVADAYESSDVATFLDGPVHHFNPMGHQGHYLNPQTYQEIQKAGLRVLECQACDYTWQFSSTKVMTEYCKQLFGMTKASSVDIENALSDYLGFTKQKNHVALNWSLQFFTLCK